MCVYVYVCALHPSFTLVLLVEFVRTDIRFFASIDANMLPGFNFLASFGILTFTHHTCTGARHGRGLRHSGRYGTPWSDRHGQQSTSRTNRCGSGNDWQCVVDVHQCVAERR